MSKSAIYTTNTAAQTIASDSIIPVGVTTRRFGQHIRQDGNVIDLLGQGYYLVNASATLIPASTGTVTIQAQKDGVPIIGASASQAVATAETPIHLSLAFLVRNVCGCESSILSFLLKDAASVVSNLAVTVEKL